MPKYFARSISRATLAGKPVEAQGFVTAPGHSNMSDAAALGLVPVVEVNGAIIAAGWYTLDPVDVPDAIGFASGDMVSLSRHFLTTK